MVGKLLIGLLVLAAGMVAYVAYILWALRQGPRD